MFTGIVQGLCRVAAVVDEPGLRRLRIDLGELALGLATGASVAVNGTCLTATQIDAGRVGFDLIRESADRSNLGAIRAGDYVNIERSLKFGDEIGGHVLSGHVADVVTVAQIDTAANERTIWFDVAPQWLPYLFHKGFVALDGASLTIARVDRERHRIAVSLIPETIARTTLGRSVVGDRVNIEIDAQTQAIVTTVERLLRDPEFRRGVGV
ncbi:MAG TPA: riboflavin synthase subunit alpha [Pseudomonadales bacterium]|nr:riboflavin synthase subunit alpha [Pseudomonadales bacterium]